MKRARADPEPELAPVTITDAQRRPNASLDPLVHVAEPLLEPKHLLPDDREAEVARFDDAGVDRPDRNLVHAVALHADDLVELAGV